MMKNRSRQLMWVLGLVKILFAVAIIVSTVPSFVSAQSTTDSWTTPLNLSRTGLAIAPGFVMDSDGVGHAIWQDDVADYLYTRLEGDQWSTPKVTNLDSLFELPLEVSPTAIYSGPNPLLIAGPGEVFAFWISVENDLFRSKVKNESFGSAPGWSSKRLLASDVASFSVVIDASGELHMAYLRAAEGSDNSPGIYYMRSSNSGTTWTVPVLLYESSYFHSLELGEANLSVASSGSGDARRIYVAWDNRPRKQVFLAQSADGGKSWEEPKLIAGPEASSGATGPFNIHVGTDDDSVVLVWQNGQPGGACSQLYQSSMDAGATWSDPQPMIPDLSGCADLNQFVRGVATSPEAPLYFLTETKNQVFITAWDGQQWSQSQVQPILVGFEEPEIFTEVILGCRRPSFFANKLYVVGCDQGDGGDVWVTARDLTTFKPPVWDQLSSVTSNQPNLGAINLVSTADGRFHVFFTQQQSTAIHYTYWDGELWSRPASVLELPEGEAAWPVIATGPNNELFLIGRSTVGTLYFSRATSGDAATGSRWSPPARLELSHDGQIGSVDATWDDTGTLSVAYSVPVNEERGIYLIQSTDKGASWSEPLQVLDGASAGFDLVGAPSLLVSENGTVHITWNQQSIQGDGIAQPLSLYYVRSEDGGRTFNDPQVIVDEPVGWRELVLDGKGNLHLLWQPHESLTVWDQVSLDGGSTWQYPQGLPDEGRLAAVTKDSAGRLHLVGVGTSALGHWLWDGTRWQAEPSLDWTSSARQENAVELLAVAANPQGELMVVLAKPTDQNDITQLGLVYSTRMLQLPKPNTSQQVATPTPLPPTSIPATPTLDDLSTPTSTPDGALATPQLQNNQTESGNSGSPLTIALVPVALLLIGVLGLVIWRAVRKNAR